MDTFLAVIVAGMMFLFAFRIASAILKSEIFWIFIGLVIVIGFFSDKNDVTNIPDSQDSSIYSSSGDNYIKESFRRIRIRASVFFSSKRYKSANIRL